MHPTITTVSRPEAMADVPGICELPLTRAVVQYRDVHELDRRGGRIQDIGLAVVVEGRFAASVRAMDLGSAEVKYLNLASELVILDWVYDPTLAHMRTLAGAEGEGAATAGGPPSGELRRFCFDLALRVLARRGFSPLSRPTLLRIGFRDICKDLDLHGSTVVRIITDPGEVTRVRLDYEANSLVFRPAGAWPFQLLEAIREVFPGVRVDPVDSAGPGGAGGCLVRFGVPVTFGELQSSLLAMRRGLGDLVARFEPERFQSVRGLVSTFGERATLERIASRGDDAGGWRIGRRMPRAVDDKPAGAREETRPMVH
ncbi:MAG: hypothetical protein OXQ94_15130 [Gemmatimonadota bacterium]|nr:hypothetical protein [Gemmatimonadota bacterium]